MVSLEPITGQVVAAEHPGRVGPGRFEALTRPALVVLDIDDGQARARSVVGDLPAASFTDGTVLPHEQVDADRVAALRRHLEASGEVSTPVSVAHADDEVVDRLLDEVTAPAPRVHIADDRGEVRLWVIDDPADRERLTSALAATGGWLIADGHHRAAAAQGVGRVLVALTADRQLCTRAFHRRLAVPRPAEAAEVLRAAGLAVTELSAPAAPRRRGETVVAAAGRWWRVDLRPGSGEPAADLDAVRVETQVLRPLATALGTPGAPVPVAPREDLAALQADGAVTVLLHPPTLTEVRRLAATGATMPAKSTFVAPKHRPGLLVVPRGRGLP